MLLQRRYCLRYQCGYKFLWVLLFALICHEAWAGLNLAFIDVILVIMLIIVAVATGKIAGYYQAKNNKRMELYFTIGVGIFIGVISVILMNDGLFYFISL